MLNKQSSGLGPKCQLCDEEQLEKCLAQLQFTERAKESVRQLFASGEVNPIIESYLQKNCALLDNQIDINERGLQARLSQQTEQEPAVGKAHEDTTPASRKPPIQPTPTPAPRPTQAAASPSPQRQTADELADISSDASTVEPYILTVLDTEHRIRLPERGGFIMGSWDALGSPHPDVNLLYDDRGQHSVSPMHARISTKGNAHYIEDLESEHGTWLNDKQLEASKPAPLKLGDTLCLGRCVLKVTEIPGYWVSSKSVFTLYTTTNGREIALPRHGELVIGRGDPTSVFTPDIDLGGGDNLALGVSRRHIAVRCWMHNIEISDLGSTNGTELEGIHIPPGIWVSIRPGQHFSLGGFGMALQVRRSKTAYIA